MQVARVHEIRAWVNDLITKSSKSRRVTTDNVAKIATLTAGSIVHTFILGRRPPIKFSPDLALKAMDA